MVFDPVKTQKIASKYENMFCKPVKNFFKRVIRHWGRLSREVVELDVFKKQGDVLLRNMVVMD